jgi:hypothetical protein
MVIKPAPCKSRWEGVFACLWLVILQVLFLQWVSVRTTDWLRFVLVFLLVASVPLFLLLVYRTWIAFSLEYWIDRNAVTVVWADARQVIPLACIRQIIVGGLQEITPHRWRYWPAPFVRPARLVGGVAIPLLATRPPSECLLLDVGSEVLAISPAGREAFLDAVQERVRMGPVANAQLMLTRRLDLQRILKTDRSGLIMLAVGLIGSVLLMGMLMVRYPSLPDVLTVRYSAEGVPEQVRDKAALFLLPLIGLLAWAVNAVWGLLMAARNQQTGAHLLWGGAIVVQICSFFALASLIG